jgi:DNA-binding SARP family transcriptional activator/Flp pilus assembly protein TadD
MTRFRILGPLEVLTGQDWTSIGASKWRAILACLLLNTGQIVSTDTLIDELWGEAPPSRATNLISIYVLRLRRLIGDTDGRVLVTRAPGYQLRLGDDDLDVQRFGILMSQGRQALTAGDPERAARLLADSLALWRGKALTDVPPSAFVEAEAERLDELWLAATELRIEADLGCGRYRDVIPELRRLLADRQLKEQLWLLLMRALDGAGRRAEALGAYEQARTVIADQLGVDPGPEIQQLFHRLLTGDMKPAAAPAAGKKEPPAGGARKKRARAAPDSGRELSVSGLDNGRAPLTSGIAQMAGAGRDPGPAGRGAGGPDAASGPAGTISIGTVETDDAADEAAPAPQPPEAGPMQLPAGIADFTGRELHVKQLYNLLSAGRSDDNPGAVPLALVAGAGGLGKTTLAIHAAHRMRSHYPDGQLYVDLLGAGPRPLAPADVLARCLRDLGVEGAKIPVSEEQRAALYRTRLNGRRMLIVLDNARDAAQVRPLLPGSSACAVIVTSRSRLSDLVGGRLVHLDVLDDSEALALFSRIVGPERTAAEPDATAELLVACAGLPLAIRISAARLAARSGWTIRALADRIGDEHRRLDELRVGDLAVRASFEVSFASLPAQVAPGGVAPARAFRMLGLWQGPSIGLGAAAALLGEPEDKVADALEFLVDGHLLESPGPDRYSFHDLLRVYAAERAHAEETAEDRERAVRRILSWYLHSAAAADIVIAPRRDRVPAEPLEAGCRPHRFADVDSALGWCDTERASIVAATSQAADQGMVNTAWQLPVLLFAAFIRWGNWAEILATHRIALACARQAQDRRAEAWVLTNLGEALGRQHSDEAIGHLEQALAIRRDIGDRVAESLTANNLADVYYLLRGPTAALGHFERALRLQREIGHRNGEAIALNNLGEAYLDLGRLNEAIDCFEQARSIFTSINATYGTGHVLHNLGRIYLVLGRSDDAFTCLREALAIHRSNGDRFNQAWTLKSFGDAHRSVGHFDDAHAAWGQALVIFEQLGDDALAAEVRSLLGASGGRDPTPEAAPAVTAPGPSAGS